MTQSLSSTCRKRQMNEKILILKINILIQGKHLPSSACTQFLQIAAHSDVGGLGSNTKEEGKD